jgi:SNF2 family DNA or RNA helicase
VPQELDHIQRWAPSRVDLGPLVPNPIELDWLTNDFAPLREAGFVVERGDDLSQRARRVESLDIEGDLADGPGGSGWFDLSLGFAVGNERVNLLPFLPQLIDAVVGLAPNATRPERIWLGAPDGRFWNVPMSELQPWLDALIELVGERGVDFGGDKLRLTRLDALRAVAGGAVVDGHMKGLADLALALRAHATPEESGPPEGLQAQLRPYQQQGLNWLQWLRRFQFGGILADDMGLGKTLQTIAHILTEKLEGRLTRPALVVAPTSLVGNWRREIERFAPSLSVLVLHGLQRKELFDRIDGHDVVVTTYPLLSRDAEVLIKQKWDVVALDEAQNIKNAKTQAAQVVSLLDARQRLALTGTPMENHLGELWSLFNFLMPGYLGSDIRFKTLFRNPIEKGGDNQRLALLRRRVAPFMLRRDKSQVASELPPKVESIERVRFEPEQANLYETIRLATEAAVREALAGKGLARSQITVLDALMKLRQACCDPRLVKLSAARKVTQSAKLDWLLEMLPEMISEGRRVLLFSQFTSMLELIEKALKPTGISWVKLTGDSTSRDAIIDRFTSGEVPLFLISLKAGGTGLNLPQADTVIHYDPWWNPAVEDQATDRAHRIGQTQTVFVYKLVAEGTLEERILTMQERKAELARGLHGGDAAAVRLTEGDIDWLLQPLGSAVAASQDSPEAVDAA